MSDYRIGDEVYIHGIIDEIRKDTIIIKNEGGYFGTISDEIMPSAQPERTEYIPETKAVWTKRDCVDLSERVLATFYDQEHEEWTQQTVTIADVLDSVCDEYTILPSAQPERTCVNCGRTANNGGWYADGGTRCPIEEHYALPKDGFCHLWEERNVTDEDYPERREE